MNEREDGTQQEEVISEQPIAADGAEQQTTEVAEPGEALAE